MHPPLPPKPKPPPKPTIVVIPSAYLVAKDWGIEHEGLCPTAGVISKVQLLVRVEFEIHRVILLSPTFSTYALWMTTREEIEAEWLKRV